MPDPIYQTMPPTPSQKSTARTSELGLFTFEFFFQDIKANSQRNTFFIPCLIMEAVGFKHLTAVALHSALWRRRWWNELHEGNSMFVEEAWALPGLYGICLHSSAHLSLLLCYEHPGGRQTVIVLAKPPQGAPAAAVRWGRLNWWNSIYTQG